MKLAVYGTLRRGGPANGLLRGSRFLGLDRVPGNLYALASFPGLRLEENHQKRGVLVDVYDVPDELIPVIDKYEGYFPEALDQSLFTRKEVTTLERKIQVVVYEYRFTSTTPLILTGDWITYASEKLP